MATEQINVEAVVKLLRELYEKYPSGLTILVYARALGGNIAAVNNEIATGLPASIVGHVEGTKKQAARVTKRIVAYQQTLETLAANPDHVFEVPDPDDPDSLMQWTADEYFGEFVVAPLLYGKAGAAPFVKKGDDLWAAFADVGEGLRLVNQLNAAGATFDATGTIEAFMGTLYENALDVSDTPAGAFAVELAEHLANAHDSADKFVRDAIGGALGPIVVASLATSVLLAVYMRGRMR